MVYSLINFLESVPRLRLVDVGVSGGVDPKWRLWGNRLSALGIDAIVDEVERLTAAETNPNVRYVAARAGAPTPSEPGTSNYALHRSQAYLATAALARPGADFNKLWRETVGGCSPTEANYSNFTDPMVDPFYAYYAHRFGQVVMPRLADRCATVDELWEGPADVLKVDTDGWDFDVLRGASRVLGSCLAVDVECQFHGPVSPTANVFCNIDAYLRGLGFSLFKLEPVRYARSALPRPFTYDIPANNERGQVVWADALYVREGVVERDRLSNLALLLDLYELEDAAAEILLESPGLFGSGALDYLAAKVHGPGVTYQQVTEAFLVDPIGFHAKLRKP